MMLGDWMLPFAYTQGIEGFDWTVYNWIGIGTIIAMLNMTERARINTTDPLSK